jgi:uroporphyrinogen-III synthase
MTVVLTRDDPELASRLHGIAAEVIELPCVRIERGDPRAIASGLASLQQGDWLVVTSRNGADAIAAAGPVRASIAAVGHATAARLRGHGYAVDFTPSVATGAALARELPMTSGVVLLARSDRALPDLPRILRERGFSVREVAAYRTMTGARGDVERVTTLLASTRNPIAVVFHSPSAIDGLLAAIDAALVARAAIFAVGPSTLRAAHERLGDNANVSLLDEEVTYAAHR